MAIIFGTAESRQSKVLSKSSFGERGSPRNNSARSHATASEMNPSREQLDRGGSFSAS